ncbi:hypothetical protein AVEN_249850-1 [Araneus ventricosus]|uniref:Uncharacterized protein n=1 Tax=Araneus ventricosus TaxID=182803 RepID=A0A4Y2KYA0_ARAVE|nr:hypothetical protein AVEN_249850-1 [Araneus ventricosus]
MLTTIPVETLAEKGMAVETPAEKVIPVETPAEKGKMEFNLRHCVMLSSLSSELPGKLVSQGWWPIRLCFFAAVLSQICHVKFAMTRQYQEKIKLAAIVHAIWDEIIYFQSHSYLFQNGKFGTRKGKSNRQGRKPMKFRTNDLNRWNSNQINFQPVLIRFFRWDP